MKHPTFNQTILELKPDWDTINNLPHNPFNQTILELKLWVLSSISFDLTLNQTILELKLIYNDG